MCVLIIKPEGIQVPSKETLDAIHTLNPDGCGIVTPTLFYKGLSFPMFKKILSEVDKKEPAIIHLRLASAGCVSLANCHPFRRDDVWFAHNGTLEIKPIGEMTDSETAFQTIIYPAIVRYGYGSPEVKAAINDIIGTSKFAMMKDGEILMFGEFLKQPDGCYYSNLKFLNKQDCDPCSK